MDPDTTQVRKVEAAARLIDRQKCPAVFEAAQLLASSFQVWEKKITVIDADGREGTLRGDFSASAGMHLWTGELDSTWLSNTIAHEAAHALYGLDESIATQKAAECAGTPEEE